MKLLRISTALIMCVMVSTPLAASAASLATTIAVGSIDVSTLFSTSPHPSLSGIAYGVQTLQLSVREAGHTETLYTSKNISVRDDRWETDITSSLPDGIYTVALSTVDGLPFIVTPTGVLIVGSHASNATLVVASIPLLHGSIATPGEVVPLSYLQVLNTGKEQTQLSGFWVRQNGSASTQAIIGLMTLDGQGALTGFTLGDSRSALFENNLAFVPAQATFAPGQMRLFTIKALINTNVSAYAGTQLMVDVASAETTGASQGAFPIRGTTWTISN